MRHATVVLHGGAIYSHKGLDAVVLGGDRILAVGRSEELLLHVGEDAVRIDLRGRAVLPGFVFAMPRDLAAPGSGSSGTAGTRAAGRIGATSSDGNSTGCHWRTRSWRSGWMDTC
jgi:hypothetical protein